MKPIPAFVPFLLLNGAPARTSRDPSPLKSPVATDHPRNSPATPYVPVFDSTYVTEGSIASGYRESANPPTAQTTSSVPGAGSSYVQGETRSPESVTEGLGNRARTSPLTRTAISPSPPTPREPGGPGAVMRDAPSDRERVKRARSAEKPPASAGGAARTICSLIEPGPNAYSRDPSVAPTRSLYDAADSDATSPPELRFSSVTPSS